MTIVVAKNRNSTALEVAPAQYAGPRGGTSRRAARYVNTRATEASSSPAPKVAKLTRTITSDAARGTKRHLVARFSSGIGQRRDAHQMTAVTMMMAAISKGHARSVGGQPGGR